MRLCTRLVSKERNDREDAVRRMLTAVFVELNSKLGEEAGRADDDEGRAGVVLPEVARKGVKAGLAEIVCDDERERRNGRAALFCGEEGVYILEQRLAGDTVVELAKEGHGLCGARLPDGGRATQEEVVACVCWSGMPRVKESKVAYAWEDEVLEDGGGSSGGGDDEDARGL